MIPLLGVDCSDWQDDSLPWAAWHARGFRVAVLRAQLGFRDDGNYARYVVEADAADFIIGAYHVIFGRAFYVIERQAAEFLTLVGPRIQFMALDIEVPGVSPDDVVEWVEYVTTRSRLPLVLYGNWDLAQIVFARPALKRFGIWWAAYPTSPELTTDPPFDQPRNVPAGLSVAGWQYAGENGRLPPYARAIDLNIWYDFPAETAQPPPVEEVVMKSGTMYGIHAEQASQAVPLMEKFAANDVQISCILAMENPGLCVDAKRIDPNILTIARWTNPNGRWEGAQDVATWSPAEREDFAIKTIQMIFDRTNDTEYQACDYFCPGINEPDPPEANGAGYKALAEVMILVCNEATRRSPEMVARGLHPIRLAILGFNSGTPEWVEMRAMRDTGLFDLMRDRGDILMVHEGVWWDMPIDTGHGDLIPGAPMVPPNGGSLCGRFNYWYALGIQVPFVVSEWYDGNTRDTPPAKRLAAMQWYDRMARRNKWFRGFAPFELTDVVDGAWWKVDFTRTFQSPEMLADMIAQKNIANPLIDPEEDDMDEPTRLALIGDMDSAAQKINHARGVLISLAPAPTPQPLYRVRIIVDALNVRAGPGTTFADVGDVARDMVLDVYEERVGWYRVNAAAQKWISGAAQYSVRV